MYLLIQKHVTGELKGHWMNEVKMSPKNGGWVEGRLISGGSLGIPLSQAEKVFPYPGTDNDVSDPH